MVAGRPMMALHIAEATGALEHDKKRFAGRATPDTAPLGDPEPGMDEQECEFWRKRLAVFWWLREHHRDAFADWVRVRVKIANGELEVKWFNLANKLGRAIGADPSSDQKFGKQEDPRKGAGKFTGR